MKARKMVYLRIALLVNYEREVYEEEVREREVGSILYGVVGYDAATQGAGAQDARGACFQQLERNHSCMSCGYAFLPSPLSTSNISTTGDCLNYYLYYKINYVALLSSTICLILILSQSKLSLMLLSCGSL